MGRIENEATLLTGAQELFINTGIVTVDAVYVDQSLEVEEPKSLKLLIKRSFKNLPLVVEMNGNATNLKDNRQARHFITWLGKNQFYSHLRLLLTDCGDICDVGKHGGLQEALKMLPPAERNRATVLEGNKEKFAAERPEIVFKTGESITISGKVFPLTKRLWYG